MKIQHHKILEANVSKNLCFTLGKKILRHDTKTEETDEVNYIQINLFFSMKDNGKIMKDKL
jgi:hypothetical protein